MCVCVCVYTNKHIHVPINLYMDIRRSIDPLNTFIASYLFIHVFVYSSIHSSLLLITRPIKLKDFLKKLYS